ncbi:S-adenosyl-L-methionine-dependent methyltransferase [Hymenopellis radicata]|nr:S-adenosyl-L-methionine-dependent methyltransferase [Hymenopellis radicata]
MSNDHIHQLIALITSAAKTIEDEFAKSPEPIIPTLDDVKPHPLDGSPGDAIRRAVAIMDGACAQLCASVAPPSHTIVNRGLGVTEAGCLDVVVNNKIPDLLKDRPEGVHVATLAKASGLDAGKLERIMRRLATSHIFREVGESVFANNRLSVQLLSDNGLSSLTMFFMDEIDKGSSVLNETLTDPVFGPSYQPQHTPWNKSSKYPRPWFAFHQAGPVETPEGAKSAERFTKTMSAFIPAVGRQGAIDIYPWGDLPNGASVCDIGGNLGQFLALLHKKHPHLKLKLQDLPIIIKQAQEEYWPAEAPDALEKQSIEFKTIDFTKEAPIPGCDVYFTSIEILKHIKSVMKPDSRILISEHILRPAVADPETKSAPAPLLPNGGVGGIRPYNMDLTMMIIVNAKERTFSEFKRLGDGAGLKFEKLWNNGESDILEFRLP